MNTDRIIKLLKEQGQIILQGAPGTGKTYATVELAVALCCPNDSNISSERRKLKEKYDELVEKGRVAFTTFHQSMDYEDFVEGYKPTTEEEREEDPNAQFVLRDGIFKKICKDAALGLENPEAKNKLIEELKKEASDQNGVKITDANGKEYQLFFSIDQWFYKCDESYSKKTMATRWNTYIQNGCSNKSLKSDTIALSICIYLKKEYPKDDFDNAWKKLCEEIQTTNKPIEVNTGEKSRQTYLLTKVEDNGSILVHRECNIPNIEDYISKSDAAGYQNAIYRKLKQLNKEARANYLLIIDEINRANISKVMGELITLLEKGKREGNEDARSAKLPYSQKKFTVPDNLYIIGTMNTADRSLGSIDYAIRRRFAFVTLEANQDLAQNHKKEFDAVKGLIEECRDDDFEVDEIMVGHSYFMPNDKDEWERNIDYKIIPLLLEYFKDGVLIDKENKIFTDIKRTKKDQLKSYLKFSKNQQNAQENENQQQSKQEAASE